MQRRDFIKGVSAAAIAASFGGFANRAKAFGEGAGVKNLRAVGYGELVPTAAKNTGEKALAVPRGFEYNILGKTGDKLSDGRLTPNEHDGMAAFEVDGRIRLVRNHEINDDVPKPNVAIGTSNHYDVMAGGGTTTTGAAPDTTQGEATTTSPGTTLGVPTVAAWPDLEVTVDLGEQRLLLPDGMPDGITIPFPTYELSY